MAILEKRRAVNQLPRFERYQDTRAGNRSAALRGETPVTSAIRQLGGSGGAGPVGGGAGPIGGGMGGAGKGTVDKFGNVAGQPKTAVTSALKGSTAANTTSKLPGLSSKTAGTTGKTLTSTGTGAAKTTGAIAKNTGAKTSGSNIGKTLTSALAGAALGAGTKFAIDKLTGAKTTKAVDTTKAGTKGVVDTAKKVVDTSKKVVDTTGAKKVIDTTGAKKVVDTTKTGTKTVGPTSVIKKTGTNSGTPPFVPKGSTAATKTAPKAGGAGSKTAGSAAKGVTAKTAAEIKAENPELTDEEVQAEFDRLQAESETYGGVPEGADDNGDGTYSVTEDGMVTTYDKDGNIIGMEAAEDTTAGEDGTNNSEVVDTVENADGTVTVTYADGSTRTIDEDFNIGDKEPSDGSTTQVLDDGSVVTYDANGDFLFITGKGGVRYDADGEVIDGSGGTRGLNGGTTTTDGEETTQEGFFTDDEGNLYDSNGDLYQYADGTFFGDEESTDGEVAYTDEYGNTYDGNGDLIAEGDHSDYVQYDDEGNAYNWDGELISSDDEYTGEDEYTAEDEYGSDDEYSSEDEYAYEGDEIDYDVKKGGLINMADGGSMDEPIDEKQNADGTITQMFDDGSSIVYNQDGEVMKVSEAKKFDDGGGAYSDTDEEVQDWQNVDYNYGEEDDPTMTGDNSLYSQSGPIRNTYTPVTSMRDRDQALMDSRPLTPLTNVNFNKPVMYTPPEGWPDGFENNFDGTATYVDPEDGSTITIDSDSNIVFVTDANGEVVAQDGEPTGGLTQANQGIQYFDDGSYIQTYEDGTSVTFDSDGNPFRSTDNEGNSQLANTSTYDDFGNQTISDYYGNIIKVLDPEGNVIPLGGGRVTGPTQVTGSGGSGATKITDPNPVDPDTGLKTKGAIDSLLAGLNTYGGAGAAGAVLGALLSDSDLFSGGSGGGSNFDMTGVGSIAPRTTDFGIGPANYVGYDEYGTPEQMPELYGQELYQNLNAPGFNEVNPGDYARYDAEEFGEPVSEDVVEEGMAEGGQPQGGLGQTYPQTYYTFGTPVDPLQNLRNPAPFQPQQQSQMPPQGAQNTQQAPQGMQPMGMPQMPQMPPMGQGMAPPMRKGGLPHASNVPMTQGRMDFRRGAAVHGAGDGQSDDIPAMLADGEYVIDAETVAQIGNGSTKAGAQALDKFRENIRMHKRSAPVNKIPPKTKALTSYLKGAR